MYVLSDEGEAEIVAEETDGDFFGQGWPEPPAEYIDEAKRINVGSGLPR